MDRFESLLAEAENEPTEGWDFSWFTGRATEERPPWRYGSLIADRLAVASDALDIQTGGGEVLAGAARARRSLSATESWLPNVAIAKRRLGPLGVGVVAAGDDVLPFRDRSFDLVVSRHPVTTAWDEIARTLRPGGTYLSQQVGAGSNRELTDFMMGPQPVSQSRSTSRHVAHAVAGGLEITDLREATLRVEFFDVGAVAYFLRKVLWTVPGFSVARYRERLLAMHQLIEREGRFVSGAKRFLIEARRPG